MKLNEATAFVKNFMYRAAPNRQISGFAPAAQSRPPGLMGEVRDAKLRERDANKKGRETASRRDAAAPIYATSALETPLEFMRQLRSGEARRRPAGIRWNSFCSCVCHRSLC